MPTSTSESVAIPAEIRIPEEDAQSVLLVRALEEADPEGELLSVADRLHATEVSQPESGFQTFLVGRARELRAVIEARTPAFRRLRRASSLRIGPLWILVPALVLGLVSNLLGPEKHINVVANPLVGLILWNAGIYLVLVLGFFRGRRRRSPEEEQGAGVGLVGSLVAWRARGLLRQGGASANAGALYVERWVPAAHELLAARLRGVLHLGATAMVVGALGGMYARGLLFEYLPTWESTFLGPEQVDAWFGLLLGPASALSGIPVPSVAALDQPGAPNAAHWIHLYAITTAWLVLLPRVLLALATARRCRSLADPMTLDTRPGYYRRVFASGHGGDLHVDVLPYSYTLTPVRTDLLKTVLHDVLGARASIVVGDSADYGDGLPAAEKDEERTIVMVFNLAQTPETEVHGRILSELKGVATDGGSCLVLVDASGWRERTGERSASDKRLDERRRTWDRVLRDAGLPAVHLDLDQPLDRELVDQIEGSFWPARDVGVAS